MAIDPNIALSVKPIELPDQLQQYARLAQIQGLKQNQEVTRRELAAQDQAAQSNARIRSVLGGVKPGADGSYDLSSIAPQLLAIDPKQGAVVLKQYGELNNQQTINKKSAAELQKAQIENHLAMFDVIERELSTANDQPSYEAAVGRIKQQLPDFDTSRVPQQYNPAAIQLNRQRAMSLKDRLAKQLEEQKLQETSRHDRATESNAAAGNQRMADQNKILNEQKDRSLALQEKAAKTNPEAQKTQDANAVLSILDQAEPLIDKATHSGFGAGVDAAGRFIGQSSDAGDAAAQLRALEGSLVAKMPKMSGPQSDKDVLLYRQMAGQIGDASVPVSAKKAAIQTIRQLNQQYATPSSESSGNKQPTKINDDAGYNALPSGAQFIAPDGSLRVKP